MIYEFEDLKISYSGRVSGSVFRVGQLGMVFAINQMTVVTLFPRVIKVKNKDKQQ